MVRVRLARGGAKKRPFYHIVASDQRSSRDGRFIEKLGFFNPVAQGKELKLRINRERVAYWVKNGAQLSKRVEKLVKDWDANPVETSAAAAPVKTSAAVAG